MIIYYTIPSTCTANAEQYYILYIYTNAARIGWKVNRDPAVIISFTTFLPNIAGLYLRCFQTLYVIVYTVMYVVASVAQMLNCMEAYTCFAGTQMMLSQKVTCSE